MKFFLGFCCSFVTVLLLVVTASCSRMTEADPNEMIEDESLVPDAVATTALDLDQLQDSNEVIENGRPVPDAFATAALDLDQLHVGANGVVTNATSEKDRLAYALSIVRNLSRQMPRPVNRKFPEVKRCLGAELENAKD